MAVLIALQIVLARFVGLQISEGLRISFESIPVILAGIWLGPLAGVLVGFLSDLFGTLISGYGVYFLPLAITPILNGLLPGLCCRYIFKSRLTFAKCVVMVIATEIISSLLLGTYALTWYYLLFVPNKQMTFSILFVTRLTKVATMVCDALLVWLLHKAAYRRVIEPIIAKIG